MEESKTNLEWDKFKPLFGTWAKKFKPFFDAGGFDPVYAYLKKESRRGKVIAPSSDFVFRCFTETPIDELMVVMCGLSPYHSIRGRNLVADGLLMGCSKTGQLQPSLIKFYEAIGREMYHGEYFTRNPDVSYLAHQGVLMLNAALTTEIRKPGNHADKWEPFMKYLFEEVLNITGAPVIFLGREAAKLERFILPLYGTYVFKVSHPASAEYNRSDWETKDVFKSVNKILKKRHGKEIVWLDMPAPF